MLCYVENVQTEAPSCQNNNFCTQALNDTKQGGAKEQENKGCLPTFVVLLYIVLCMTKYRVMNTAKKALSYSVSDLRLRFL